MATVLKEAENLASKELSERLRILRLSENYNQYGIYELIARISENQVVFTKLDDQQNEYGEDEDRIKPAAKNYNLTAAEADAFVKAWLQYKTDRAHTLIIEEARLAGVEQEARALATELDLEISTDEDYPNRFHIKHAHRYLSSSYAYTVDGLLSNIKSFQAQLEDEKQAIVEAREVANKITALCGDTIKITSQKPAYNGHYDLSMPGRFNAYSLCNVRASEVLERLQSILRDLEREQAQTENAVS